MLVYERMTVDPITVPPSTPIDEALRLMREHNVRRFPVIDPKSGKMVGIVTEKELLYAAPSPATSLSMHEIHYLLAKLTVEKVMTRDPIAVSEDTALEEAARIMIDRGIGALPVMRGQALVGIITETDIFKTFAELFAAREAGVRLTLLVPEQKGELLAITQAIFDLGGDVRSLGTFQGEDSSNRLLTIKVSDAPQEALIEALRAIGAQIVDVRTCLQAVAC
jgi:acetoin utilization protein AcuB